MTFRFSYKLIAAAVAILIACSALAQNSASKQWSDGPLNWADFQAVAPSGERSNLKTDIFIVTKNIPGTDGTTRMELSTQALMYPSQSAASAASQTTLRLRYHQLQFDLLEYYRRCLQNDLNSGTNGKAAEERLA